MFVSLNALCRRLGWMDPNRLVHKAFNETNMTNGLFHRFLFTYDPDEEKPIHWSEEDLPSTSAEDWSSFLMNVLHFALDIENTKGRENLELSKEAWEQLKAWQNAKEDFLYQNEEEHSIAIFRKNQIYALRFCIIIHVMREIAGDIPMSTSIDEHTARQAILLAEYFFKTSVLAYQQIKYKGKEELWICKDVEGFEKLDEKNNPRIKILRYLITQGAKIDIKSCQEYLIPYVDFSIWNDFDQSDQYVHLCCFFKTILALCWDLPEYFTDYKPVDIEKLHLYDAIDTKDKNGNWVTVIVDETYETVRVFHFKLYEFRQYKRVVGQVLSGKIDESIATKLIELYSDEIMNCYDRNLNVYQAADLLLAKF